MSTVKLTELKTRLDELLKSGFVCLDSRPWRASVLSVSKKNGGLGMVA